MDTRKFLILVSAVLAFVIASCSGDRQPGKAEIEHALTAKLPGFVSLSSLSIDAMENMGTKVDPVWAARFHATVTMQAATFLPDGSGSGVLFVRLARKAGDSIQLFGKSTSRLQSGAWQTSVVLEDQSSQISLGQPEAAFAPTKVIIRGSAAEAAYNAEQAEKQRAEQQRAAEIAAAARVAQTPTRQVGQYVYLSGGGDSYMAPEAWGKLTLSDVGIELSGEQPNGTTNKESLTFYRAFQEISTPNSSGEMTIYRIKERQGWGGLSVIWYPVSGANGQSRRSFSFHTLEERDRYFTDFTKALRDWAARYPNFATARINIR